MHATDYTAELTTISSCWVPETETEFRPVSNSDGRQMYRYGFKTDCLWDHWLCAAVWTVACEIVATCNVYNVAGRFRLYICTSHRKTKRDKDLRFWEIGNRFIQTRLHTRLNRVAEKYAEMRIKWIKRTIAYCN